MIAPFCDIDSCRATAVNEYRICQPVSAATDVPVTMAYWCSFEGKAMLTYDQLVALSPDMASYLQGEAQRRGVGIEEVYREEMAAKAELTKITPRNADLLRIAERCPAPQTWYDE
jgi:hypothetical protein